MPGAETRIAPEFSICIVGGGPNALYCVERLLAQVINTPSLGARLSLIVVDMRGAFGAGCHYPWQPTTNHLNRIASQISFGADESNEGQVSALLPKELRATLHSWCVDRYAKTKNERYEVSEREWVERSLFGEASCDVFDTYVAQLRRFGVRVEQVKDRVVGMHREDGGYRLSFQSGQPERRCGAAVLCTGHTENKPQPGDRSFAFAEHAKADRVARYVHHVYPIEAVDAAAVAPGEIAICRGLGLAAIDVILHLTEGRGGYFVPTGDSIRPLRYVRSGFEPARIFPFSSTGVFLFARAYNEKLNDSALFQSGTFFTKAAIDQLRENVGIEGSLKRQLDFARHILPLMIVEMQRIYYQTLFGKPSYAQIEPSLAAAVKRFVSGGAALFASAEDAMTNLTGIATAHFTELAKRLEQTIAGNPVIAPEDEQALQAFCQVYTGAPAGTLGTDVSALRSLLAEPSPYYHQPQPSAHIFDWDTLNDPLRAQRGHAPATIGASATRFFANDLADATQGNISNPRKAAIDGVWRDMRDTVRYCVEFGGLLAESQRYFMDIIHRITNRIAVGTSLKMMTKISALVEEGVIDMSYGLSPDLSVADGGFRLTLKSAGASITGQVLINASVHRFNVSNTEDRLYRTLMDGGLIREWCIAGATDKKTFFATGGIEVDPETNLVIEKDGRLNHNLGLLGAPSEGPLYFHLAAVRPYCGDPVIADADKVICALLKRLAAPDKLRFSNNIEEAIP